MITLLPTYQEMLVVPNSAKDVYQRLASATSSRIFLQPHEPILLFNGWVHNDRFRISFRARRVNHFFPLAFGQIESTSTGCILLTSYTLFPYMRLLLSFWTMLIVLGAIVGWFQYKTPYAPLTAIIILISIYFVVWSNFRIHLGQFREALHRVVS